VGGAGELGVLLQLLLDGLTPSRTTTGRLVAVLLTDELLGELSSPE
jgi:hypothetical protein